MEKSVAEWIARISEKRNELGGFSICPFAKKALEDKKIFLAMNGFEGWKCAADSDFMGRLYKTGKKVLLSKDVLFSTLIEKFIYYKILKLNFSRSD